MEGDDQPGFSERLGQALAVPIFIAAIAGVVLLVIGVDPGTIEPKKDPGFVDLIFGNRTVLLFVRVALIAAALYVFVSVVALVVRRKWLVSALGFQASEEDVRALKDAAEYWQAEAFGLAQQVQELTQRVEEMDHLVENLVSLEDDESEGDPEPLTEG